MISIKDERRLRRAGQQDRPEEPRLQRLDESRDRGLRALGPHDPLHAATEDVSIDWEHYVQSRLIDFQRR